MAAGGEVQLLGSWHSPYVVRVKVALGMKGLSYEYTEQDLFGKSDLLLRSYPVHKKVPVLIHAGRPICESLVILQYIDNAWAGAGPSHLPTDAHDRATARFWSAFVDDKVYDGSSDLVDAGNNPALAPRISSEITRSATTCDFCDVVAVFAALEGTV